MQKINPEMALVAKWTPKQDSCHEPPNSVKWEDGTLATQNDYFEHLTDTYRCVADPTGAIEMHIFPGVVADVRFDEVAGGWAVSGPSVISVALGLTDPTASDSQIIAELFTFPVVYRAQIHR